VVRRKPDPLVLIEIAQKDFEAASVLFEQKLYSQAIYMLQQSLEKAIKASLLKLGIIESEEELKKEIEHSAMKKASQLLADIVPRRLIASFTEALKKNEIKERELILDTIIQSILFYGEFLRREEEFLKLIHEMKEKAFARATKEEIKKVNELVDKVFSSLFLLTSPLEDMEAIRPRFLESLKFLKPPKSYEEFVSEIVINIDLVHVTTLLMLFHAFLEPSNMEVLRYEMRPEELDEEMIIVWWSKDVMEQLRKTELLRTLEKEIRRDFEDPEVRKILELHKQVLGLSAGAKCDLCGSDENVLVDHYEDHIKRRLNICMKCHANLHVAIYFHAYDSLWSEGYGDPLKREYYERLHRVLVNKGLIRCDKCKSKLLPRT